MSQFLDRLNFLSRNVETFSGGHGVVTNEKSQGDATAWIAARLR